MALLEDSEDSRDSFRVHLRKHDAEVVAMRQQQQQQQQQQEVQSTPSPNP